MPLGGYTLYQVAKTALAHAQKEYEGVMQALHDRKQWLWIRNKTLSNYHFPESGSAPQPLLENKPDWMENVNATEGVQYIFQKV